MDWKHLNGRTALVTGAASGIGRETALALARRGADLVICDLDEKGLDTTAGDIRHLGGGTVHSQVVDVASAEQVEALARDVHARVQAVDLLVNNAGVAIGGGFLDTELADWEWILGVNLRGVIHGCHYFVPAMVQRGAGGHVVNVSSAAGYVASAELAAYCTTKFGVLGLSESLRDELAPHGIGVTAICPGIINTPITRAAKLVGPDANDEARDAMVAFYQRRNYGPDRVARGILRAIERNRGVAPITPEAWIFYYGKRLAPGLLARLSRLARNRGRRRLGLEAPADR
jgi:NAD(P)-dependent dehydrogenase (short-subunit alcohol dehydrogenase family)